MNIKFYNQEGMASLPTVLALLMLMMVLGGLISSIGLSELESSNNLASSAKAKQYAQAGIKDALERIARNKDYLCESAPGCPGGNYQLAFADNGCANNMACATVTVSGSATLKTIMSIGASSNNRRKINATITLDSDGLITDTNWHDE